MEHRAGDCNGEEIPKKTRSLDLKSLYETEGSKEAPCKNLKRKGGVEDDDGDVKRNSKRKKSRKAVSINRLKTITANGTTPKKKEDSAYGDAICCGMFIKDHYHDHVCGSSPGLEKKKGSNSCIGQLGEEAIPKV
ncbi:unnamed protein product [Linum trigynum]|uniref:Uncharacterized protein n=1 Tax=Linum trigynum TaxID=586398 RepID=A0AAV2DBY8_9ROSI